ncbi:MAG TPA: 3-oxoacyl-ACP reductase family protein [Pyrinomonadaceae bacterium]|nr:3-oxoacyl-ACP reductase family protein [Pyrinomonadaceae bacterium]
MHPSDLQLRDRVAVVTGGSRGIGRAIVDLLSELGAHVVVNYLSGQEAAEATVIAARGRGVEAISVRADVANPLEAQELIAAAVERFKRVDILVCNAGIWEGSPLEEMSEELWDRTMEINLKGTWTVCRAVVSRMREQRSGKIVILTSTAGQRGEANYSNYAASKGAQIAFTKSLAAELGRWGINVNAVAPGWVDTEMTREALGDAKQREAITRTIPMGKIAAPEDIAAPVAFLCSDWARHISGEILNVNGGSVLCG